ncbi:hypothetical protein [Brasilonema bromeliae]|uniref:DUF4352 domain-containing protein n=1 Tax=Brasilonema bromeliae SPC951 TaxID=385972 RepID=A0ABX1P3K9_9CYAN|nr:hypothetical protein [Brasilonema bromeliae SPC951]
MSIFLSSVAVLLSTLALLCSGYTAYQVFTLQQTLNVASAGNKNATTSTQKTSSSETSTVPPDNKPNPSEASSSSTTTAQSPATTGSAIKPGQFVQPSFGQKAEVELLSVKRIKDPETANRDVVNVQMRIRRVATDGINPAESVGVYNTTARNPDTSETYKGVNLKRSTGSVELFSLRPQASADAYVWLRIPEGVNSIDVFVPDTAAFKNVPVSN